MPQTILVGAVSFIAFTTAGAGLARLTFAGRSAVWFIDALLLAMVLMLRRRRINNWSGTPLEFEDTLPTEMNPLKLSGD